MNFFCDSFDQPGIDAGFRKGAHKAVQGVFLIARPAWLMKETSVWAKMSRAGSVRWLSLVASRLSRGRSRATIARSCRFAQLLHSFVSCSVDGCFTAGVGFESILRDHAGEAWPVDSVAIFQSSQRPIAKPRYFQKVFSG